MKNNDGWHKFSIKNIDELSGDSWVNEYEVLVVDGKVVHGVRNGRTVYPYTDCKAGGWSKDMGLSLAALRVRLVRGTAAMM